MNKWYPVLVAVLICLLFSGLLVFLFVTPKGTPIVIATNAIVPSIKYEIYGAINQPGIYSAEGVLRVEEAVQRAGGFLENADKEKSSLAMVIRDGDTIWIPTAGPEGVEITPIRSSIQNRININTADISMLMTLPGIGEKKAQDIIDLREALGGFDNLAQLLEISGIGEKTVEQFSDLVVID